jgi:hypothetical protein
MGTAGVSWAWLHCGGEAEQGGEAGGVVAGAGGEDAGVLLEGFGGGGGGEDGVEVGGEEDVGDWGWRARAMSRRQMRGSLHCGGKCAAFGRDDGLSYLSLFFS